MSDLFKTQRGERFWKWLCGGIITATGLACINAIVALGLWVEQWPEPGCYPGHEDWPWCEEES